MGNIISIFPALNLNFIFKVGNDFFARFPNLFELTIFNDKYLFLFHIIFQKNNKMNFHNDHNFYICHIIEIHLLLFKGNQLLENDTLDKFNAKDNETVLVMVQNPNNSYY